MLDKAGGRANLFKAVMRKQILLNDESAAYLTLHDIGRGVMFYPVAPPSGHYTEIKIASKVLAKRPLKSTLLLGSSFSAFLSIWMASLYSSWQARTLHKHKQLGNQSHKHRGHEMGATIPCPCGKVLWRCQAGVPAPRYMICVQHRSVRVSTEKQPGCLNISLLCPSAHFPPLV